MHTTVVGAWLKAEAQCPVAERGVESHPHNIQGSAAGARLQTLEILELGFRDRMHSRPEEPNSFGNVRAS